MNKLNHEWPPDSQGAGLPNAHMEQNGYFFGDTSISKPSLNDLKKNTIGHKSTFDNGKNCADFITVLKAESPINKSFFVDADGNLQKTSSTFYTGTATTIYVPDLESLQQILSMVGSEPCCCIITGFIPGAEVDQPYTILPVEKLNEAVRNGVLMPDPANKKFYVDTNGKRYATRTKNNFTFGSYALFDKDENGSNDLDQWFDDMAQVIPGFLKEDILIVPSNSSRVVPIDQDKNASFSKWHCYIKVKNPSDLYDFGIRFLTTAFSKGFKFYKDSTNDIALPRTIIDHSVFSPERVIYEGQPTCMATGYKVLPFSSEIYKGVKN